jgi:short-subunit dehydrogenase
MVQAGQPGTIINIASILGLRVRPQVVAYAATKAAFFLRPAVLRGE